MIILQFRLVYQVILPIPSRIGMIYDLGFGKLGAVCSFWNFTSILDAARGHQWSQWRAGVGLLISHPLHLAADSSYPQSRLSTYQEWRCSKLC